VIDGLVEVGPHAGELDRGGDRAVDLPRVAAAADDLAERVGACQRGLAGQRDVRPDVERLEQLDALEGAAEPEPGPLRRARVGDVRAVQRDPAG
jgi:hypothetical protein